MLTGMEAGGVIVSGGAVRTLASLTNLGVFYVAPNQLEVTSPANPVLIDTGAAMVGGFYFYNDASVSIQLPINRVNDEQVPPHTARISRVASGGVIQDVNLAMYWDIPLATVTTDGAGNATVNSDDREWVDYKIRQTLVPCVGGTGTINPILAHDLRGLTTDNNAINLAWGYWTCPDHIDDFVAELVLIPGAGGGNCYCYNEVYYGACNELYTTHSYFNPGPAGTYIATPLAVQNTQYCVLPAPLTLLSAGDIIHFQFGRDATDPLDTVGTDVFIPGWLVTYRSDH